MSEPVNCVWGDEPDDNDCFNGWHAFVECVNCGEFSDYCIYEKSADKQVRVCSDPAEVSS